MGKLLAQGRQRWAAPESEQRKEPQSVPPQEFGGEGIIGIINALIFSAAFYGTIFLIWR